MMLHHSEVFQPIQDFPGYEISDLGTVRSYWRRVGLGQGMGTQCVLENHPQRVLRHSLAAGYPSVTLAKDGRHYTKTVHTLILTAFVGLPPPGSHSRHRDGIRAHSWLTNLTWGTPKENAADTKAHGHTLTGTKNHRAHLTEPQVQEIRQLATQGCYQQRAIAATFHVSQAEIWNIIHRRTWRHLP